MNRNGISTQILQLVDGGLVFASFWLTASLRDPIRNVLGMSSIDSSPLEGLSVIIGIAVFVVPLILESSGFYILRGGIIRALKVACVGVSISSAILVVLMVAIKIPIESRFFFLGLPPILILVLIFRKWLVHCYLTNRAAHEARKSSVQLFGTEEETKSFLENLNPEEQLNWDIKNSLDLDEIEINNLVDILKEGSIARAVFVSSKTEFSRVSRAVELCESMGVETMVAADFLRTKLSIPEINQIGGRTMITLRSTPSVSYALVAKKLLDRIGSAILILASLPFWIVAMVGIKITSPKASVFFKQKRAGLYGRPFTMWKFRTMRPNSEALRDQIIAEHGNQMDGPVFKLDNDPRVFAFGKILRKTSIDELPQLINVFMGEMSLVGPRPLPLVEVEDFQKSEHRRRLSVKPGITCYWQAGGRNTITSFEEWVDLDLKYIDNWSFLLDIKILLMTIPAVLFKKGAK